MTATRLRRWLAKYWERSIFVALAVGSVAASWTDSYWRFCAIAILLAGFALVEHLKSRQARARMTSLEAIRTALVSASLDLPRKPLERSLHYLGESLFDDATTEWRISLYRASRTAGWQRLSVAGNASGELGGYSSIPNGMGFSKYITVFPNRAIGVTALPPFSYDRTKGRFAAIGSEAAWAEFHASLSLQDLLPPTGSMRPDFYLVAYAAARDDVDTCLTLLVEADRGGFGIAGPDDIVVKRLVSLGLMDALADLSLLDRSVNSSKEALAQALMEVNEIYRN